MPAEVGMECWPDHFFWGEIGQNRSGERLAWAARRVSIANQFTELREFLKKGGSRVE